MHPEESGARFHQDRGADAQYEVFEPRRFRDRQQDLDPLLDPHGHDGHVAAHLGLPNHPGDPVERVAARVSGQPEAGARFADRHGRPGRRGAVGGQFLEQAGVVGRRQFHRDRHFLPHAQQPAARVHP
jgi:hypothetical protein